MADLTPTGLVTRTQEEILGLIEADQREAISESLDQSTSSPLGQINRLFARSLALLEEALAAQYAALDPDGATGDALDRISALTGTIREAATPSRVVVRCLLDAGTYPAGTLRAAPAGRPLDTFVNEEEVVTLGDDPLVTFVAERTGPISVAEDTLEIASPVSGWIAITENLDAVLGEVVETDEELRVRRTSEVESPGSSSAAGIAADLTRTIPEIELVNVIENDTDATVDTVPPHSIEVVVFGGPATLAGNTAVAEQILASKAAGIGTAGATSVTVQDSQGQSKTVRFTRPSEIAVTVSVTLVMRATTYAGDAEVAATIARRAQEELVPGLDVSWSQVISWCHEVQGVLRVSSVTIQGGSPFTDLGINPRQIAQISSGSVTVISSAGTP